jgi:DNA-binding Lrp family transcriptional regulator
VFALDDIDRKLLGELLKDSKRSYRELARAIGVSAATVINHVQRLESAGVIKDYSVRLDHERLGYELTVITEITVSKGKLLETEEEIAKISNACAVYDVTGLTDAMVVAKFKSRSDLSEFTHPRRPHNYEGRLQDAQRLLTLVFLSIFSPSLKFLLNRRVYFDSKSSWIFHLLLAIKYNNVDSRNYCR